MKNKSRRKLLLLIILMIPILAFYGCGGNDDEDPVDETPVDDVDDEDVDDVDEEPSDDEDGEDPADDEDEDTGEDVDLETIFGAIDYPENFSYEMTTDSQEMGSYTTRLWIMGEKMRSEGEWEGQVFISIQDGEYFYTLDPETMTAMRFPIDQDDPMEGDFDDEPRADEFMIDDDWDRLEYVGEETLNGVRTFVVIDRFEDIEYKMWIHYEYGIPMRIESSGPNPEDDYVMQVTNLRVGDVTDEDFEVPEDYEIMDFGF